MNCLYCKISAPIGLKLKKTSFMVRRNNYIAENLILLRQFLVIFVYILIRRTLINN